MQESISLLVKSSRATNKDRTAYMIKSKSSIEPGPHIGLYCCCCRWRDCHL